MGTTWWFELRVEIGLARGNMKPQHCDPLSVVSLWFYCGHCPGWGSTVTVHGLWSCKLLFSPLLRKEFLVARKTKKGCEWNGEEEEKGRMNSERDSHNLRIWFWVLWMFSLFELGTVDRANILIYHVPSWVLSNFGRKFRRQTVPIIMNITLWESPLWCNYTTNN